MSQTPLFRAWIVNKIDPDSSKSPKSNLAFPISSKLQIGFEQGLSGSNKTSNIAKILPHK